jgi:hypothetical protein
VSSGRSAAAVKEENNLTAQSSKIDYWTFFAREAKRGHSPLYEHLAAGIGVTPELQAMAARVKKGQPPANLLLGAVHYLLLAGQDHPLADRYPSVRPNAKPSGDAFPLFKDFCLTFEKQLMPLIERVSKFKCRPSKAMFCMAYCVCPNSTPPFDRSRRPLELLVSRYIRPKSSNSEGLSPEI